MITINAYLSQGQQIINSIFLSSQSNLTQSKMNQQKRPRAIESFTKNTNTQ